jgi:plastocyanin
VLAGTLGLAACGGDTTSSEDTVPADADLVVTALEGIKWDKSEYTSPAGTIEVALVNASSQPHNLHVIAEDGTENPVVLEIPSKGDIDVASMTLEAGTYTLICTIPGHGNMKAPLVVG